MSHNKITRTHYKGARNNFLLLIWSSLLRWLGFIIPPKPITTSSYRHTKELSTQWIKKAKTQIGPGNEPPKCTQTPPKPKKIPQKFEFNHVTKTGGTALKETLGQYTQTSNLIPNKYDGHVTRAQDVHDRNHDSITVIREPVDRFLSSFNYWRNSSERYHEWQETKLRTQFTDINQFVQSLRDGNPDAWTLMNQGDPQVRGIRDVHFQKQIWWLNGDLNKSHLIAYDKDPEQFKANIQAVFDRIGVTGIDLSKLNVINKTHTTKDRPVFKVGDLTPQNRAWVENHYKDDYPVYHMAQMNRPFSTPRI